MFRSRIFRLVGAGALALSACTTERVQTEFGALNDLVAKTDRRVSPRLAVGIEAAQEAELTASAAAGDAWFLSDDCNLVLSADVSVPTTNCTVEQVRVGDRGPVLNEALAARRKLDALAAYVAALEFISEATLEEDVTAAYAAALEAVGEVGKAAESQSLLAFLRERAEARERTDAVVSAGIAALRYRRMRETVLAADDDVATLVRELQLHLVNLGADPEFRPRLDALRAAEDDVLLFDTTDVPGYRAAIVTLQREHESFMDFYEGTAVYEVGLIAQVHGTLADTLRGPGGREDIVDYLKSLKALVETVKEA